MPAPLQTCAVIPALNEQETIAGVAAAAGRATDLVVVVDNASTDATAARAASAGALVVAEPVPGYGRACLTGARAAPPGSVLLFIDGDGADDPSAFARVLGPVCSGAADLALGSRVRGRHEAGAVRVHQQWGNRLFAGLIRARWHLTLTDLGPLRAIGRDTLLALEPRSQTYGWPVETLVLAAVAGLRVVEVPVDSRARVAGTSKVSGNLRASLQAGWCFSAVLLRHGAGRASRGRR